MNDRRLLDRLIQEHDYELRKEEAAKRAARLVQHARELFRTGEHRQTLSVYAQVPAEYLGPADRKRIAMSSKALRKQAGAGE